MDQIDRLSVSEVTTLHASFESDVATYRAAGLGGIGVWESKLTGRDPYEVADVLDAAGLRVTNLVPNGKLGVRERARPGTGGSRGTHGRPLRQAPRACGAAAGNGRGRDRQRARAATRPSYADAVSPSCAVSRRELAELGLTVALEPMHPSAGDDFSFVTSLGAAADLVADIGHPRCRDPLRHVARWPGSQCCRRADSRLGADRRQSTSPTWSRLRAAGPTGSSPGRARYRSGSSCRVLEAGGFQGSYDVEIFSDDGTFGRRFADSLWELPEDECVARATALMRRLLNSA